MEVNENQNKTNSYNDLVKFGVLLLIFAGTILVVSLLRPLIFGRIVPAILGNTQAAAPLPVVPVVPSPASSEAPAYPGPSEMVTPPETGMGAAAYPSPDEATTAEGDPQFITHILQPGENLTRLATRYNVSVNAIIQANPNIPNPNNIQAGTSLQIPVAP
jgi:LysM repeat protein